MPSIYVDSSRTGGTNAGTSWANAYLLLSSALSSANNAPGDVIYVASGHSEAAYGAATTFVSDGTITSPINVYVVDATGDPATPTTSASGVVISTGSGASWSISINGVAYFQGFIFKAGVGATSNPVINAPGSSGSQQRYENCEFWVSATGTSGASVTPGVDSTSSGTRVEWQNVSVKFAATAQYIDLRAIDFFWEGGGFVSGTSAITNLFSSTRQRHPKVMVSGVDLSAGAAAMILVASASGTSGTFVFRDCKLPGSWSGNPINFGATPVGYARSEVYNCSAGDQNFHVWIKDPWGECKQSTTVYRDGGITAGLDGAASTSYSWLITTTSFAEYPCLIFNSPEIAIWNDTTGSSQTATVEIVHDGASALTDKDIWLETMYLGTSGVPLGSWTRDEQTEVLGSGSAQATSSATWTGDSGTGPNGSSTWNQLKLVTTFTAQEKGYLLCRVCMGIASKSVYVDPLITVA